MRTEARLIALQRLPGIDLVDGPTICIKVVQTIRGQRLVERLFLRPVERVLGRTFALGQSVRLGLFGSFGGRSRVPEEPVEGRDPALVRTRIGSLRLELGWYSRCCGVNRPNGSC